LSLYLSNFRPKKKDLSTAILEKKKAPNKLTVEDSKNDDNTIIELTEAKMEELKLMRGDQVLLRGKLV
jgi:transitional endoplasmic reticulum ATPase